VNLTTLKIISNKIDFGRGFMASLLALGNESQRLSATMGSATMKMYMNDA